MTEPEHPGEQRPAAEEAGPDRPVEGAEPQPRGVRTMGLVRWGLLAAVALLALFSLVHYCPSERSATVEQRSERYWCPMHPQVRSPGPGQCPICHMDLVPIPPGMASGGAAAPDGGAAQADAGQGGTGPAPDAGHPGMVPVNLALQRLQLGGVEVGPAVVKRVGAVLRLPASVEVPETSLSHVHLRTPGFLERVAVRQTGARVERGQPLAWVYSPKLYQAQLELLAANRWSGGGQADAGAQQVKAELRRTAEAGRAALELQGMAAQDIDQVLRTNQAMRDVPLRSPAGGYVVAIQAVLGMYATEDMILYTIADLSRVWAVGSVYPDNLPELRTGMTARFEPQAGSGGSIEGRVELIPPEVGAATRTATVRLAVDNPELELRPGQYGNLVFELAGRDALVVPRDAVVDTGEHQYVFLDRGGGRFEPHAVRQGELFGEEREVLSGLEPGDRVVTRGTFLLDSESRLAAAVEAAPPAASGGGAPSAETGPDCNSAFDRQRYPDKYRQCLECERVHAGMGSMVADCKDAIPQPWR